MYKTIIRYNNKAKARAQLDMAEFDTEELAKKYMEDKVKELEFHGWHIVRKEIFKEA